MTIQKPSTGREQDVSDDAELMVLDVFCIESYERNPRRSENSEYDRIKSSIRNNGLDQPLVVTQRPQSTGYIVRAGGNTRLKILKELHVETGDPNFARSLCIHTLALRVRGPGSTSQGE